MWRFEFIGEMGIDAGGLAREWFELVCKEIFDPDMGLWMSSTTNQMSMTINPAGGTFFNILRDVFVCSVISLFLKISSRVLAFQNLFATITWSITAFWDV